MWNSKPALSRLNSFSCPRTFSILTGKSTASQFCTRHVSCGEKECNDVTYPTSHTGDFIDPLVGLAAVSWGSEVVDGGFDESHCVRVASVGDACQVEFVRVELGVWLQSSRTFYTRYATQPIGSLSWAGHHCHPSVSQCLHGSIVGAITNSHSNSMGQITQHVIPAPTAYSCTAKQYKYTVNYCTTKNTNSLGNRK